MNCKKCEYETNCELPCIKRQRDGIPREAPGSITLTLGEARIIIEMVHLNGGPRYEQIRDGLVKKVLPVFEALRRK